MKNLYCRHLREADGQFGHRFVFQSRGEAPAAKVPEAAAPAPTTEAKPAEPAKAAEGATKEAKKAADSGASALKQVSLRPDKFKDTWAQKTAKDDTRASIKDAPVSLKIASFNNKQNPVLNIRGENGEVKAHITSTENNRGVKLAETNKTYNVAGEDFVKIIYGNDQGGYVALRYVRFAPLAAPPPAPAAAAPAVAAAPAAAPADVPVAPPAAVSAAPAAAPAKPPAEVKSVEQKNQSDSLRPVVAAPTEPQAARAPQDAEYYKSGDFFQVRADVGSLKKGEIIYSPAKIAGNELPTDAVVVRRDGSQVKLTAALTALQQLTPDTNARDKGLQKIFLADAAQSTKRPVEEIKVAAKDTATPSIIKANSVKVAEGEVAVAASAIVKNTPASADTKPPKTEVAAKTAPPAAVPTAAPAAAPQAAPTAAPAVAAAKSEQTPPSTAEQVNAVLDTAGAALNAELSKTTGVNIELANTSFSPTEINSIRQRTPQIIEAARKILGQDASKLNNLATPIKILVPTQVMIGQTLQLVAESIANELRGQKAA